MARSPFTLAAAVTAALPGAEVTGARPLTADGESRFDSAVASLADGRELAIRVADDDEAARELAAEALALRALTAGARAMLPFRAPEYVGETRLGDGRALVTELLPGFQIEAALVPSGRGAATSMGAAIAAVHALPASVVRSAGLTARSAEESRDELRRLVDAAAATGRVPARLTVRWRDAVADDDLWRFEATVVLGGVQATSFVFDDDPELGPHVTGLLGWHGLSLGDPAVDLAWLSTAPEAAADVHASYAAGADRVPDAAIAVRARLLAELEFARWLVHGDSLRREDIIADAAALLESLADGLSGDLAVHTGAEESDVDSALDALDRVPSAAPLAVDTSMQTDAYNPDELWADTTDPTTSNAARKDARDAGDVEQGATDGGKDHAGSVEVETEDLSSLIDLSTRPGNGGHATGSPAGATPHPGGSDGADVDSAVDPADEAQRAARAALQRWKSSDSE